jgi:hypothetical protein
MKLKKLPGFSLGLIALAVGNAYATQLLDDYSIISYMTDEESPIEIKDNNPISNGEYLTTEDESHAVKVDDGVTGYINNRDNTRVDNYLRNNAFPSMIQAFTASNPFSRILTVRN